MKSKFKRLLALPYFLSFMFLICGKIVFADNDQITDIKWSLSQLDDQSINSIIEKNIELNRGGAPYLVLHSKMSDCKSNEPYSVHYICDASHNFFYYNGVNTWIGLYELKDQGIKFIPSGTTEAAQRKFSDQFDQMIRSASKWKIVDSHLELYDENGQFLARFEPSKENSDG
jgi:hypothetical protein